MDIRFTVPGEPGGYVAKPGRLWPGRDDAVSQRTRRYWTYCEKVRIFALQAGVRLPLTASREDPLYLDIVCYFKDRRHPDPLNVRKGIEDALFYAGRSGSKGSGDKYTGGSFDVPRYDEQAPRVEVRLFRGGVDYARFEWERAACAKAAAVG